MIDLPGKTLLAVLLGALVAWPQITERSGVIDLLREAEVEARSVEQGASRRILLMNIAASYAFAGESARAESIAAEFEGEDRDSAATGVAIAYRQIGQLSRAESLMRSVGRTWERSAFIEVGIYQAVRSRDEVQLWRLVEQADPRPSDETLIDAASVSIEQGNLRTAQRLLKELEDFSAKRPPEERAFSAEVLGDIARLHGKLGDSASAHRLMTVAFNAAASDEEDRTGRGQLALPALAGDQAAIGDVRGARRTISSIRDEYSRDLARKNIILVLVEQQKLDAARELLAEVKDAAWQIKGHRELAHGLARTGQEDSAIAELMKAHSLVQQLNGPFLQASTLIDLATTAEAIQQREQAISFLQEATARLREEHSYLKATAGCEIAARWAAMGDAQSAIATARNISLAYKRAEAFSAIIGTTKGSPGSLARDLNQAEKDPAVRAQVLLSAAQRILRPDTPIGGCSIEGTL